MSDSLTGVDESPSRPVVYDVLNISQEELNVLSQSVKSEPTSPECDEPNTPPDRYNIHTCLYMSAVYAENSHYSQIGSFT